MKKEYQSFKEFYPYYLKEHRNKVCRRLHFIGSLFVLAIIAWSVTTATWWGLALTPVCGYGFAWVGHFFFEKNKPATFDYPLYSLAGDWVMFRDILTGKLRF